MTLKPTIRDGVWVYLPPPKQDTEWLRAKEIENERTSTERKAG